MEVNGSRVPWAVAFAIISLAFASGGIAWNVSAIAEDQKEHEDKPSHAEAAINMATVQADVKHNKAAIEEVKRKQDEAAKQQAEDKAEILRAIREQ